MKTKLFSAFVFCAALTLSAQEGNLIPHGDFEKLPAGRVNMVTSMKKSGLDINRDPVALTPGWYSKKGGAPSVQVIQAAGDKSNVASGEAALNVKAGLLHLYTSKQFASGTYDLSFAYKGKGRVEIALYFYNAKGKHLGNSKAKVSLSAKPEWQTYNGKITITAEKPETAKARFVFIFVSSDITIDDIVLKPAK